jgi:rhodanese-related sulfurtransferase
MVKTLTRPVRALAWILIKVWLRKTFPEVPSLTTQELARQLDAGEEFSPILLDARKNEEFAVSHLPNAYLAGQVETVQQMDLSPDQPMVVYCSVGYRSARLVQKLQQAGFSEAKNLEGSIFQWANEGRPLVRDGKPVETVHPYNPTWGLLLEGSGQNHDTLDLAASSGSVEDID